jgi:diguanylate cyclase (GGDEF)-like protein
MISIGELRLLVLFLLLIWQGPVLAVPLTLDYRCDAPQTHFEPTELNAHKGWQPANGAGVVLPADQRPCWIRIDYEQSAARASESLYLSFLDLNVLLVDIELYDAGGTHLGKAVRLGQSQGSLVSGTQATFVIDSGTAFPLMAKILPIPNVGRIPGFSRELKIQADTSPVSLRDDHQEDLLSQSAAAFLLCTALIAIFFAIALREADYTIYAVYAVLQSWLIFTKSGLTFTLEGDPLVMLNPWAIQYLNAVFSLLLSVRFGRFMQHSPFIGKLAYGVGIGFLLLIPLNFYFPDSAGRLIFLLLPLHFLVLFGGNIRGWLQGERSCAILLVGLAPIGIYWAVFLYFNVLLQEPIPTEFAIGSAFDYLRTLLLPLAFYFGIADRSLRAQRETVRIARTDPLTGLKSREGLRHFESTYKNDAEQGQSCVLMVNIERFRSINSALGPELGDRILQQTALRLSHILQAYPRACLGRTHADHFCLLIPDVTDLDALQHQLEESFFKPVEIAGQVVDISISAGVARVDQPDTPFSILIRNAELALGTGRVLRKRWVVYGQTLESGNRADLGLLSELRRAADMNELTIHLQPKVSMQDGSVTSAEALIRWVHPQRGMIPPSEFIPFAESTGRITLITRSVIHSAMRYVKAQRELGKPIQISVNLSVFDLCEPGFASETLAAAVRLGARPQDIRLEVTESGAMQDPGMALAVMNELHQAGFSLSIDDFGTGYSSLAYLQKMPVAELKIDRAFVAKVKPDTDGALLLDSIISLGHRLGLAVVAEGAETLEEWNLLKSLGCDYVQGWFVSKALPTDDFERWCLNKSPFSP